ncbi:MAG: F420-0:Gamma-glutamyl ligase [Aphanocapsa sp. GSE-SYN-MK-11-07L]|jgi:hypothetical protein|nr:F420-0:Gamma-glutamyl ligase [Aphanocapsa sp. GSE-SYN-MK-11-07L]
MNLVVGGVALIVALVILIWLGLELKYARRPGFPLEVIRGNWDLDRTQPEHYVLTGEMGLSNPRLDLEVMVPELTAAVTLLSKQSVAAIAHRVTITPAHPDAAARADCYWFAYIVKTCQQTQVKLQIDLTGPDLAALQAAWVRVNYVVYGPKGRTHRTHHEVVPFVFPQPQPQEALAWRSVEQGAVLPIRTHLLNPLDQPVEIVKRYVVPYARPGDVVTIGETPIAIMQGRWRHPSEIQPGWVATRVCQFFLPTSSLATACGMQTLVDIVGPTRVLLAFLGGAIAKVFGHAGGFYQLAGEEARLIDDVTGTLPPYDQFVVLGPVNPQQVVDQIRQETGLAAAIVDVNDLKAVKVLAATSEDLIPFLITALRANPAGNADEQTPVVLIRPKA